MKRLLKLTSIALLGLSMGWMAGCKTATTTAPTAPGYLNAADQQLGEIMAAAHAFYNTIQQESIAGQITLTSTEKTAFNAFAVAINSADSIYLAYHANPTAANLTLAQAAVTTVQNEQSTLPVPTVK
jgi:hypothetical protein